MFAAPKATRLWDLYIYFFLLIDELARGINGSDGCMHAALSVLSRLGRPSFYSSIFIFCSLRLSSVAVIISFLVFSLLILRHFTALSFVCLTFVKSRIMSY